MEGLGGLRVEELVDFGLGQAFGFEKGGFARKGSIADGFVLEEFGGRVEEGGA